MEWYGIGLDQELISSDLNYRCWRYGLVFAEDMYLCWLGHYAECNWVLMLSIFFKSQDEERRAAYFTVHCLITFLESLTSEGKFLSLRNYKNVCMSDAYLLWLHCFSSFLSIVFQTILSCRMKKYKGQQSEKYNCVLLSTYIILWSKVALHFTSEPVVTVLLF